PYPTGECLKATGIVPWNWSGGATIVRSFAKQTWTHSCAVTRHGDPGFVAAPWNQCHHSMRSRFGLSLVARASLREFPGAHDPGLAVGRARLRCDPREPDCQRCFLKAGPLAAS